MRATSVLRATLPVHVRVKNVGQFKLLPDLRETSAWPNKFIGALGCELRAADAPSLITSRFDTVVEEQLPRSVRTLLRGDTEDGIVKSINTAIAEMSSHDRESAVDVYVNGVLRGCDINDGVTRRLLAQEPLSFKLGTLEVVSEPDHILRCGVTPETVVDIVTQESKQAGARGLVWGQLVGEMIAAALANDLQDLDLPMPPIFGIRVVGTRWTFLRAEFSQEYLDRLSSYTLEPSDRFQVWAWGGPSVRNHRQTATVQWGLDYNDSVERQQILRMIVALGHEARGLVAAAGL